MIDCPFCGASGASDLRIVTKQLRSSNTPYSRYGAYVRCLRCSARGPLVSLDGYDYDVRNERPSKECEIEVVAKAAIAWDAARRGHSDPNSFVLESGVKA